MRNHEKCLQQRKRLLVAITKMQCIAHLCTKVSAIDAFQTDGTEACIFTIILHSTVPVDVFWRSRPDTALNTDLRTRLAISCEPACNRIYLQKKHSRRRGPSRLCFRFCASEALALAQHFVVQPIILIALNARLNLTPFRPPLRFRGGSQMQQHVHDNKKRRNRSENLQRRGSRHPGQRPDGY